MDAFTALVQERDFLVALVQRGDLVAIEREVTTDRLRIAIGVLVRPDRILDHLAGDLQRPVTGVALERAVGLVPRAFEEVHADVLGREVMHWPHARLVQDDGARGVGDELAVELDPNPLPARLVTDLVACLPRRGFPGQYRFGHGVAFVGEP